MTRSVVKKKKNWKGRKRRSRLEGFGWTYGNEHEM